MHPHRVKGAVCGFSFLAKVRGQSSHLFFFPNRNNWEGTREVFLWVFHVLWFLLYRPNNTDDLLERKTTSPTQLKRFTRLWGLQMRHASFGPKDKRFLWKCRWRKLHRWQKIAAVCRKVWVLEVKMKVCLVSSAGEVFTWGACVCVLVCHSLSHLSINSLCKRKAAAKSLLQKKQSVIRVKQRQTGWISIKWI